MTSDGELYINGECVDLFKDELDKWFGENNWWIDYTKYIDCWDLKDLPNKMELIVKGRGDNQEKIIGKVEITNEFSIEDNGYGKFINVNPTEIKNLFLENL